MKRSCTLLAVLVTLSGCSGSLTYKFEVPREQLQKKTESKFPMHTAEEDQSSPVSMTMTNPKIVLEDGKDQIGLKADMEAVFSGPRPPHLPKNMPLKKNLLKGHVLVFFSIRYDSEHKTIHLSDPKVESLDIASMPKNVAQKVSRLTEKILAKKFETEPMPLEAKSLKDVTVKAILKSVEVKDGKVFVEIGP